MGSALGLSEEKLLSLADWEPSALFDPIERLALAYADAMTITGRDVDDGLFGALAAHFSPEALVELTALIAWENSSSKFNRALRVSSQELWKR